MDNRSETLKKLNVLFHRYGWCHFDEQDSRDVAVQQSECTELNKVDSDEDSVVVKKASTLTKRRVVCDSDDDFDNDYVCHESVPNYTEQPVQAKMPTQPIQQIPQHIFELNDEEDDDVLIPSTTSKFHSARKKLHRILSSSDEEDEQVEQENEQTTETTEDAHNTFIYALHGKFRQGATADNSTTERESRLAVSTKLDNFVDDPAEAEEDDIDTMENSQEEEEEEEEEGEEEEDSEGESVGYSNDSSDLEEEYSGSVHQSDLDFIDSDSYSDDAASRRSSTGSTASSSTHTGSGISTAGGSDEERNVPPPVVAHRKVSGGTGSKVSGRGAKRPSASVPLSASIIDLTQSPIPVGRQHKEQQKGYATPSKKTTTTTAAAATTGTGKRRAQSNKATSTPSAVAADSAPTAAAPPPTTTAGKRKFNAQKGALAADWYAECNAAVFAGRLPADMPISWSKRLLTTAGYCELRRSAGGGGSGGGAAASGAAASGAGAGGAGKGEFDGRSANISLSIKVRHGLFVVCTHTCFPCARFCSVSICCNLIDVLIFVFLCHW
jgi:hypothetical protein